MLGGRVRRGGGRRFGMLTRVINMPERRRVEGGERERRER